MNCSQIVSTTFLVAVMILAQEPAFCQSAKQSQNVAPEKATPTKYGVWERVEADRQGARLSVLRLKVYPKAAPLPALKHRLVPAPAERTNGNAAPAYLKAMGFVEQNNARMELTKLEREWYEKATPEQQSNVDYPPYNWSKIPPSQLPLEQVERYLHLISFQEPMLYDAARRKNYSQYRAMERESNPIGYLLPEVQQMRDLARKQIVRCRFAIAQNRTDDAVEIIGQMMAMANHVGQDEFIVSCLVGVAIQGLATTEGLNLSQQESTPNLYWAIAACPQPIIDVSNAIKTERSLLKRQFPSLNEVDETVRPKEYWSDFVKRILPKWNEFAEELNTWNQTANLPSDLDSFQFATRIAARYEPARRFLNEVCGMSNEQLDAYPTTQVAFLAMLKYHAIANDKATTLFYLPFSYKRKLPDSDLKRWQAELGWISKAVDSFMLPSSQIYEAITRENQRTALWQTVEALRMTASHNNGKAPATIDEFVVPAPLDPVCNKPFEYAVNENVVTLRGAVVGGARFQLIIEIAK